MYVHTETASPHYSEAREVRHTLVLVGWTKHHLIPCQLHAFAHTIASTSTNEEIAERKSSSWRWLDAPLLSDIRLSPLI